MGFIGLIAMLLVAVVAFSFIHNGVEGGRIPISKEEDLELEKLLEIRSKPKPVKTIKSRVGDIYDCIDIQKQPALDHPLFKNHIVQMKPTSSPMEDVTSTSPGDDLSQPGIVTVDCPKGTVPIRRLSKEDLTRSRSFSKSYAVNIHPQTQDNPSHHYAIMKSTGTEQRFHGIGANINVETLTVGDSQTSTAQMWIENSANGVITSLQTGWMVSPTQNHDSQTRLFAYWHSETGGCFNTDCVPGFTQISSTHPVDAVFAPASVYGGQQYIVTISIVEDKPAGKWWLQLNNEDGSNPVHIGYWTKDVLPRLEGGASYVAWGGHVWGVPTGPAAPMGKGRPFDNDSEDFLRQSYFSKLKIYDASSSRISPDAGQLEEYVDNTNCYGLKYFRINGDMGVTFMYGGQGGDCGP